MAAQAISINGIHHIGLSVPDIERARDFYVGLLGFEEGSRVEWGGAAEVDAIMRLRGTSGKMMILRAGNAFIEMFEFATPVPDRPVGERGINQYGFTHLCLDVDDTEAAYARLLAAGLIYGFPLDEQAHGRIRRKLAERDATPAIEPPAAVDGLV